MKALRLTTAVVVLLAVGLFVGARLRGSAAKRYFPKPVRIVSLESQVNRDGSSTVRAVHIRWVTEDGAWKLINLDPAGHSSTALYSDGQGVFAESKDQTLSQLSKRADSSGPHLAHPSADAFLHSKQFVREDQICGYRAFVFKDGNADAYQEVWYTLEVGAIPVKIVMHTDGQADIVNEAIKIDFAPVTPEEVQRPSGPVIEKFVKKN